MSDKAKPVQILLTCFAFIALAVTACNVADDTVIGPVDDASGLLHGLDPVVGARQYNSSGINIAAISELITYRMPGVGGNIVESQAIVLLPQGQVPDGGFPVVAWGHGTTGVADACAPSVLGELAGYSTYVNQLVANGYAVVAPDYEGLGSDGLHPYLHLASEGRSLIYAVNAAARQYPDLSKKYAAVGHSQGGHAALAAGEYASEVDDVSLVGVAAIAPASNLREQHALLTAVITDESISVPERLPFAIQQLLFSGLVLNGVTAVDEDFDSSVAFGTNGNRLQTSLGLQCSGDISQQLVGSATATLFISNSVDSIISTDAVNLPEVARYISNNEPGSRVTHAPVMLLQGGNDDIVLPESTTRLRNLLLRVNGMDPVLVEYPMADHNSIVSLSSGAVLNFLANLF